MNAFAQPSAWASGASVAEGDIHVGRDGDDWVVTVEGIKGALVSYDTRDEALRAAEKLAAAARSKLQADSQGEPGVSEFAGPTSGPDPPLETLAWPGPIDEEPPLFAA